MARAKPTSVNAPLQREAPAYLNGSAVVEPRRVGGAPVADEGGGRSQPAPPNQNQPASLEAELEAARNRIASLEAELHASQIEANYFSTVLRHIPTIMFALDAEGRFTLSRGSGLREIGLADDEAVGTSALEMYADEPMILASLQRALRGEAFAVETQTNGRHFRVWHSPIVKPGQPPAGSVGVAIDITEAKRLEEQLRCLNAELDARVQQRTRDLEAANARLAQEICERQTASEELERSRQMWQALVHYAPDIIIRVNRSGEIDYVNHPEDERLKSGEFPQGQATDFVDPECRPLAAAALKRVFERGESVTIEVSSTNASTGERQWFECHLGPVHCHDRVESAIVVCRNVTDSRQISEQMARQQAELAHLSRVNTAGEIAATLAHEMNQPLSSIVCQTQGCLQLLRSGKTDVAVLSQHLQEAAAEAFRAAALIRDLRQFVRRQEQQFVHADLNDLVRGAARLAGMEARHRNVVLELQLAVEVPAICVDSLQMTQVILNLLLNGMEAMVETPLEQRLLTLKTSKQGTDRVRVEVTDRGAGLPDDLGVTIFDPFVSTKSTGMGMGLSICRTLVDAHQGEMFAENHPDGGAVVGFWLPIGQAAATPGLHASTPAPFYRASDRPFDAGESSPAVESRPQTSH